MRFYHFQFSIKKYVKLRRKGFRMCEGGFTSGDKDVSMVFENHVAGIFVRDIIVIL